jgi:hypothetical protein
MAFVGIKFKFPTGAQAEYDSNLSIFLRKTRILAQKTLKQWEEKISESKDTTKELLIDIYDRKALLGSLGNLQECLMGISKAKPKKLNERLLAPSVYHGIYAALCNFLVESSKNTVPIATMSDYSERMAQMQHLRDPFESEKAAKMRENSMFGNPYRRRTSNSVNEHEETLAVDEVSPANSPNGRKRRRLDKFTFGRVPDRVRPLIVPTFGSFSEIATTYEKIKELHERDIPESAPTTPIQESLEITIPDLTDASETDSNASLSPSRARKRLIDTSASPVKRRKYVSPAEIQKSVLLVMKQYSFYHRQSVQKLMADIQDFLHDSNTPMDAKQECLNNWIYLAKSFKRRDFYDFLIEKSKEQ